MFTHSEKVYAILEETHGKKKLWLFVSYYVPSVLQQFQSKCVYNNRTAFKICKHYTGRFPPFFFAKIERECSLFANCLTSGPSQK